MIFLKILIVVWLLAVVGNIITILVSAKKADTYYEEHPIDYWIDANYESKQNKEDK